MNGLYISYNPRNIGYIWSPNPGETQNAPVYTVPRGECEFNFFFKPIIEAMQPLYWFVDKSPSTPFSSIYEDENWEDEDWSHPFYIPDVPCLWGPGILPAYANDVPNDWQTLIGIEGDLGKSSAIARLIYDQYDEPLYKLIEQYSPLTFFCVDGFVWEIYARDNELIKSVERHLTGKGGITLKQTELLQRDSLYQFGKG